MEIIAALLAVAVNLFVFVVKAAIVAASSVLVVREWRKPRK